MRSKVKKALCCAAAIAAAAGIAAVSGCSDYYKSDALDADNSYTNVSSNGGFAVETGDYIYFINGVESYDADNTYGDVEKGSIVRIKKTDYAAGNYSTVETVVPLIAYSGSYDSGIYIYGEYIYYSTPSTNRDGSGEILNSQLEFKRTKLDGTETMKDCYINITDSSVEYRYVQDTSGDVYLLYVVSENIFEDTTSSVTNIHSLKLTGDNAGTNTLLAYDVDEYVFDSSDLESPYVYYTMAVTYNLGTGYDGESTDYSTEADYNQVYRVSAFETEANSYDFSYVEDYDYDSNPLYVNCGDLIFDGVGAYSQLTQFNYGWEEYASANGYTAGDAITQYYTDASSLSGYSYSLTDYSDGTLYYTRSYYSSDSSSTPIWFYLSDSEITSSWNAVDENPAVLNGTEAGAAAATSAADIEEHTLLLDGSSVSDYTIYTGENNTTPTYVMYVESATSGYAMMWASFDSGKLTDKYVITNTDSDVTYLLTNEETVDGTDYTFLYYSVSDEANSYSVHRIALYGSQENYVQYPKYQDYTGEDETMIAARAAESNYIDVQILDLDVASWYMPEIIEGQFMFASANDDMSDYNYIMVCDLRSSSSSETMSNYDIKELNELYDDVIAEIDDTDEDNYENLLNALYYVFYTRDSEYLAELVQLWVDEDEDEEYLYSKESQQLYLDFYNAEGDYADYGADSGYTKTINGEEVHATSRDYYYTLIGYMSEDDAEDYIDGMRDTYMQAEPEEESWWDGLETWVKVIFIVGVSLAGLLIIAAAVLIPIFVIRKKHKKLPSYSKSKIKVDTTDDMDIDVYGTEEDETEGGDDLPEDGSKE
ncbi:MAG: hypothetical protein LUF82_05795 [Clostridia bacterium]|nr:hypothetical protein [Clostridia bacterium]